MDHIDRVYMRLIQYADSLSFYKLHPRSQTNA